MASGLEKFRQAYPQYAEVPDKELGDALYAAYYKDQVPKDQFDAQFYPVPPSPSLGDSIAAGFDTLAQTGGGLLAGVGETVGSDSVKQAGLDIIDSHQKAYNEKMQGAVDWRNIRSAGDLVDYMSQVVGLNAAQMGTILGSGVLAEILAGGAAAQAPVPPAGLPGLIAKAGAFAIGAGIAAYPLFVGQNVVRQTQEGEDPQLGKAAAYAIPQAAAEALFAGVLGKIAKPFAEPTSHLLSKGAKSIGEALAVGVPAEVVQQALERASADLPTWVDNPEALSEYLDTAVAATVLSGGLGAVQTGVSTLRSAKGAEEAPQEVDLDSVSSKVDPAKVETVGATQQDNVPSESKALVPYMSGYGSPEGINNFVKAEQDTLKGSMSVLKDLGWTDEQIAANSGRINEFARLATLKRASRNIDYGYSEPFTVTKPSDVTGAPVRTLAVDEGTRGKLASLLRKERTNNANVTKTENRLNKARQEGTTQEIVNLEKKLKEHKDTLEETKKSIDDLKKTQQKKLEPTAYMSDEEKAQNVVAKQIAEEAAAEQERNQIAFDRHNDLKTAIREQEAEAALRQEQEDKAVQDSLDKTKETNQEAQDANTANRQAILKSARDNLKQAETQVDPSDRAMLGIQRAVGDYVEGAPSGTVSPFEIQLALKDQGLEPTIKTVRDALNNIVETQPKGAKGEPGKSFLYKADNGEFVRGDTYSPFQTTRTRQQRNEVADAHQAKVEEVVKSTPLPESVKEQLSPVMDNIAKAVKGISPDLNVQFVNDLSDSAGSIRGVQARNTIYVALGDNINPLETAYHEAYHYVAHELNVLSDSDKNVLARAKDDIVKKIASVSDIREGDLNNLYESGVDGQHEVEAIAFGLSKTNPNFPAKGVFEKVRNFLTRLRNGLRGNGFRTFEDVFNNVKGPLTAEDGANAASGLRYQRLYEAHAKMRGIQRTGGDIPVEDTYGNFQQALNLMSSLPARATRSPLYARLVNLAVAKKQTVSKYMMSDQRKFDRLRTNIPNYNAASQLLAHMRETNQPMELDSSGNVVYKNAEGETRVMSPQISEVAKGLHSLFRDKLLDFKQVARDRLNDVNVDPNTPTDQILTKINDFNDKINAIEADGPVEGVDAVDQLKEYKDTLQSIYDVVKPIEDTIASNRVYVPFMRFGDVGVAVKNKETGETVEFHAFEKKPFSGKYDDKAINSLILDLNKKYNSGEFEVSKPFTINRDNIVNRLSSRMVTTELLSSLMASGDSETFSRVSESINKKLALKGFARHFDQAKGVPGYSKDWERTAVTYLSSSAFYLSNIIHGADVARMDSQIENLRGNIRDDVRRDFDYLFNTPGGDQTTLRMFNFLYTMGFNVSTALLNVLTLPTSTTSLLMQWDSNFFKHWGNISGSFRDATELVTRGTKPNINYVEVSEVFSEENVGKLIKKKRMTEEEGKAMRKMSALGLTQESLVEDSLEGTRWSATEMGGRLMRGAKKAVNFAAAPTGYMEALTRSATALAVFRSLNSEAKIERAKKSYENDARFKDWMENLPEGVSEREAITAFAIQEAHAIFGKEGRGPAQRGLWGSLVFPFMTYPMQMLELLGKQAFSRGGSGKAAAAYTMSSYLLLAGAMGIPGAELWKTVYEMYSRLFKGNEVDAVNEIRKTLVNEYGFDPNTALFFTNGLFRTQFGVDVARRISLPVFFQTPLIGLMQGSTEARDYLGVTGSLIQSAKQIQQGISEGENPSASVLQTMAPVALANIWKGLVKYTSSGASTGQGTRLVNPEDFQPQDFLAQAFGFTPGIVAEEREKNRERMLQASGYRVGQNSFVERISKYTEEQIRERREPNPDKKKIRELQQQIVTERKNLVKWAKEVGLPITASFWQGINQSVTNRLRQRLSPEAYSNLKGPRRDEQAIRKVFDVENK